jgi:hypothetical protein
VEEEKTDYNGNPAFILPVKVLAGKVKAEKPTTAGEDTTLQRNRAGGRNESISTVPRPQHGGGSWQEALGNRWWAMSRLLLQVTSRRSALTPRSTKYVPVSSQEVILVLTVHL